MKKVVEAQKDDFLHLNQFMLRRSTPDRKRVVDTMIKAFFARLVEEE